MPYYCCVGPDRHMNQYDKFDCFDIIDYVCGKCRKALKTTRYINPPVSGSLFTPLRVAVPAEGAVSAPYMRYTHIHDRTCSDEPTRPPSPRHYSVLGSSTETTETVARVVDVTGFGTPDPFWFPPESARREADSQELLCSFLVSRKAGNFFCAMALLASTLNPPYATLGLRPCPSQDWCILQVRLIISLAQGRSSVATRSATPSIGTYSSQKQQRVKLLTLIM